MTLLEDPAQAPAAAETTGAAAPEMARPAGVTPDEPGDPEASSWSPPPLLRPLLVAALTSVASALMTGGIFGSWPARGLAAAGALGGVAWALFVVRRPGRRLLKHVLLVPLVVVVATALVAIDAPSQSPLSLIAKAVHSGRVLRPPVPFDPGWRPVLFCLFVMVGFAAGWAGTALRRPQIALVLPLPVLAVTAITQPAEGELVAGFLSLVPLLAAVGVLFGGDAGGAPKLGRDFEVKRLARAVVAGAAVVAVLILASQSSFLFPKPAYNPAQKPQKPKAIPLSAAKDRVLFEVASEDGGDPPITGPWVVGALDVYDGTGWRLAPINPSRLRSIPSDGVVDNTHQPEITVKFTVRDMGDTSTFPTVALPVRLSFPGQSVLFDPRTETVRIKSGRIPSNSSYTMSMPKYPTAVQLEGAGSNIPKPMKEFLEVPPPPPAVKDLLLRAPQNPWRRLDFVRSRLDQVAIATGAGSPGPVAPSTVERLLMGNHEGTPFEIVAAEAMLARWAGVPARIGFGFDAGQKEGAVTTLRPKNAAEFLEVWFEGYGWIPVISQPPKAKTSFTTDKNQQFDPTIQPSDDVAVELVIPFQLESLVQVYQRVRDVVVNVLPYALALLVLYLALPIAQKGRRRSKRRRWAQANGVAAQVAVEYAEFRDLTTDLSLGDPYDTPLEFLDRVMADDEHEEFAWLVARVLYGDLRRAPTDEEARDAMAMGDSLRKRMFRAQALQSRVLGLMSWASLTEPYTREVPNVRLLKIRLPKRTPTPPRRRRAPWWRAALARIGLGPSNVALGGRP